MNARILKAIKELPTPLAAAMEAIVSTPDFNATISPQDFDELLTVSGLSDEEFRVALFPVA